MSTHTSQPIHGNYHGYYSKRPSSNDPRLSLIPPSLFRGARVLDVGCNEGLVTCQIAQTSGARKVVGVDIDDTLVRAAWKRRRTIWSLQGPAAHEQAIIDDATTGGKRKRKDADQESFQGSPDYFPASCEHMLGPIPIPSQASLADVFPHNVVFRAADWVNTEIVEDAEGYDIIIAFSVTKWIHLNDGDAGLRRFFERVHKVLKPGGVFVMEPQEWDSYQKAKRIDAKLRENAKELKLPPDNFEEVLIGMGFSAAEHLGKVGEGGFRRPVDLYRKQR